MSQEKISFEQAIQAGSDIQSLAGEINTILANVSLEMEKIDGEAWQSANASKVRSDFEILKSSFASVYSAIDTMGQAINASGKMFETGEMSSNK